MVKYLWGDNMNITLIPSVKYINKEDVKNNTVVIIDVLRATSVITTALNNGAKEVIAAMEIDEALNLRKDNTFLGGERKAKKIEGFDFANSPLEYTKEKVLGKTIVMTTTNGTVAINKSIGAYKIYIGCMLNGIEVAKRAVKAKRDIVIVCAGTGGKFSLDDFICGGKIISNIKAICDVNMDDFAAAAFMAYYNNKDNVKEYIKMASHYKYLISIGLKEDIDYCFEEDIIKIVPEYNHGRITI